VHLVGFTIEIYYDAWSYKRQIINQIHSKWNSKFKLLLSLSSEYYVPNVNWSSFNVALNNADKFYQSKTRLEQLTWINVVLVYSWWDLQQPDSWVDDRIQAAFLDCLTLQEKCFEIFGTIRPTAQYQISEDLNMW